jgi:hypothetical protein
MARSPKRLSEAAESLLFKLAEDNLRLGFDSLDRLSLTLRNRRGASIEGLKRGLRVRTGSVQLGFGEGLFRVCKESARSLQGGF